jgi:hypothetical protein
LKLRLNIFLAFHSALQEFATPPATCDTSSKVVVDETVEKNLCFVKPKRNAYNAKLHCERNGMQLYRPNSSPQALQALVTLAKTTLGNNKRIEVFVSGRSGNKCQALQGNGELIDFSCNTRSSFVCEYLEVTTKTKCAISDPIGASSFVNLTGITSPTICYCFDSFKNGNTAIAVNAALLHCNPHDTQQTNIFQLTLSQASQTFKELPMMVVLSLKFRTAAWGACLDSKFYR